MWKEQKEEWIGRMDGKVEKVRERGEEEQKRKKKQRTKGIDAVFSFYMRECMSC